MPDVGKLEGIVQTTDDATGVLRWWPASGVDLSLSLGFSRTANVDHVQGNDQNGVHGAIAFRLVR